MKCIQNPISKEIRRLSNDEAAYNVIYYRWVYVSKAQYKAQKAEGLRQAVRRKV